MRALPLVVLFWWSACSAPMPSPVTPSGPNAAVAAAHPLAAEAGADMLRRGGNAVDAAVATAFALGVVEPMMSGIGGGGSMTVWLDAEAQAEHVEFYATAGADPDYVLDEVARDDVARERGVAVPGAVAGLLEAHTRWGTLPRAVVLAPAIRLAEDGFYVHTLLARVIESNRDKLTYTAESAAIFYPDGEALQAGDRLRQPRLGATLRRIAEEGRDGYYTGPVAEETVAVLQAAGSPLTLADFAAYAPRLRRPLCSDYRGYTVLTSPPPLGGAEVLATLELLEAYDLAALGVPATDPAALGLFADAIRIARADRVAYIGDPDQAAVPAVGMASAAFADERRAWMGQGRVPDSLGWGDPWDEERGSQPTACRTLNAFAPTTFARPAELGRVEREDEDDAQTTHLSVIDAEGNAVALTYTMGLYFGTGAYAAGAFLNSAAYNFGGAASNQRAPNKIPRSTTAPTLVLENGTARIAVGAAGSGRIGPATASMISYLLDWELSPEAAIGQPRLYPHVDTPTVEVEQGIATEALTALRARGYRFAVRPPRDMYFGGVHVVYVAPDGRRLGAADPRRDGAVRYE